MSWVLLVRDVIAAGRVRAGGWYDAQWSSSVDGGRGRIGWRLASDGVSRCERQGACVAANAEAGWREVMDEAGLAKREPLVGTWEARWGYVATLHAELPRWGLVVWTAGMFTSACAAWPQAVVLVCEGVWVECVCHVHSRGRFVRWEGRCRY